MTNPATRIMTPEHASQYCEKICRLAPVIPVLVVDELAQAQPLAQALVAGGLPVLEVTLRTTVALDVITAMAEIPGGIVGAGTLLTPQDVANAKAAGAQFGVSPGATPKILDACADLELPLLPGAATASEAMALYERGYSVQKFFPAGAAGGPDFLKSLASPLPKIRFCPTGGVSAANADSYLALPNVLCVGGSWVAPKSMVQAGDWAGITARALAAQKLG